MSTSLDEQLTDTVSEYPPPSRPSSGSGCTSFGRKWKKSGARRAGGRGGGLEIEKVGFCRVNAKERVSVFRREMKTIKRKEGGRVLWLSSVYSWASTWPHEGSTGGKGGGAE